MAQDAANTTTSHHAPFGLTWGQSAEEVRASGVTLSDGGNPTDYGVAHTAESLKGVLSDMESVMLFFGLRNRLWRIFAVSRGMGPDQYGYPGIRRYQELLGILTERYGKGNETDDKGEAYSRHPEMYVFYLSQNSARRYVEFVSDGVAIQLGLRGAAGDITRWVLFYENIREAAAFVKDKAEKEKGIL